MNLTQRSYVGSAVFVCQCGVVTDGEVRRAIACGARDLCGIAEQCGAGRICGGCIPTLVALLREQGFDDAPLSAAEIRAALGRSAVREKIDAQ